MIIELPLYNLKTILISAYLFMITNIGYSQHETHEDLFQKYDVTGSTTLYDLDKINGFMLAMATHWNEHYPHPLLKFSIP